MSRDTDVQLALQGTLPFNTKPKSKTRPGVRKNEDGPFYAYGVKDGVVPTAPNAKCLNTLSAPLYSDSFFCYHHTCCTSHGAILI